MSLKNYYNSISALNAERLEIVGNLSRAALDIRECESAFVFIAVEMDHSEFVGVLFGNCIDCIKCEVILVFINKVDRGECADRVFCCLDEFID